MWIWLPASVCEALSSRADSFPALPDGTRQRLGQRQAEALYSICSDSLTGSTEQDGSGQPLVTVTLNPTNLNQEEAGETGLTVTAGPRLGPETLDLLLCTGRFEIDLIREDGRLVEVGDSFTCLPPRLRRYILARDQGCTADGCTSRHRLQVHHIVPRSLGGDNHPDNLTTLCWFHHQVVIHGMGYRIDPDTPPGRRRFLKPNTSGPDPP